MRSPIAGGSYRRIARRFQRQLAAIPVFTSRLSSWPIPGAPAAILSPARPSAARLGPLGSLRPHRRRERARPIEVRFCRRRATDAALFDRRAISGSWSG